MVPKCVATLYLGKMGHKIHRREEKSPQPIASRVPSDMKGTFNRSDTVVYANPNLPQLNVVESLPIFS